MHLKQHILTRLQEVIDTYTFAAMDHHFIPRVESAVATTLEHLAADGSIPKHIHRSFTLNAVHDTCTINLHPDLQKYIDGLFDSIADALERSCSLKPLPDWSAFYWDEDVSMQQSRVRSSAHFAEREIQHQIINVLRRCVNQGLIPEHHQIDEYSVQLDRDIFARRTIITFNPELQELIVDQSCPDPLLRRG